MKNNSDKHLATDEPSLDPIDMVRFHVWRYYSKQIQWYGIDVDDIVQEALCSMLEGAGSINSAVQVAVRREVVHCKREVALAYIQNVVVNRCTDE